MRRGYDGLRRCLWGSRGGGQRSLRARYRIRIRLCRPLASYRCEGADPVVRACVIPSLSRNCIAISEQARIGSSSEHFTSIALSPCSMRKWAALEGGCGAWPVVVVGLPGCGGGAGAAPGADGRGPPDGGCGGCAKAAVASSAAATPKYTDGLFQHCPLLDQWGVAAPAPANELKTWRLRTLAINSDRRFAFPLEWARLSRQGPKYGRRYLRLRAGVAQAALPLLAQVLGRSRRLRDQ